MRFLANKLCAVIFIPNEFIPFLFPSVGKIKQEFALRPSIIFFGTFNQNQKMNTTLIPFRVN